MQVADVVIGFLDIEKRRSLRDSALKLAAIATAHRLLLLGSLRPSLPVYSTRTSRRAANSALDTLKAIEDGPRRRQPRSPNSSPPLSSAAISKPCSASASSTTSSPAKAKSSHFNFWDAASTLHERNRRRPTRRPQAKMPAAGSCAWNGIKRSRDRRGQTETPRRTKMQQDHRPLQRHRHLRRQRHRLPTLEIRPARQRLRLPKISTTYPKPTPCWITTDAQRRSRCTASSASRLPSTTSSTRARLICRTSSPRPSRAWATPKPPTTPPTSPMRWSRSLRAAPAEIGYEHQRGRPSSLSSKSAAARASASKPTT